MASGKEGVRDSQPVLWQGPAGQQGSLEALAKTCDSREWVRTRGCTVSRPHRAQHCCPENTQEAARPQGEGSRPAGLLWRSPARARLSEGGLLRGPGASRGRSPAPATSRPSQLTGLQFRKPSGAQGLPPANLSPTVLGTPGGGKASQVPTLVKHALHRRREEARAP